MSIAYKFDPDDGFLPASEVLRRYRVSKATLDRWNARPDLGFPKPTYLGRLRFWRIADLQRWEKARAAGKGAADEWT